LILPSAIDINPIIIEVCELISSSTTRIAANLTERRFLGIDLEENFLEISKNRKLEIENSKVASLYKSKINGFITPKQLELFVANEPVTEYIRELIF
jgi:site-specific DNA-methyltransferase (adenine-specific)